MNALKGLLDFLVFLEKGKIPYDLKHYREDAVMVILAVPGERWEVEFFVDERIELEVFGGSATVRAIELPELCARIKAKN